MIITRVSFIASSRSSYLALARRHAFRREPGVDFGDVARKVRAELIAGMRIRGAGLGDQRQYVGARMGRTPHRACVVEVRTADLARVIGVTLADRERAGIQ